MYDFEYHKPGAIDDAVKALGADAEAKALAGGMTFIPVLKQRLAKPSAVVDLAGLGLTGIRREGNALVIKAMTTHREVAMSSEVASAIPALAALASNIGDRQVRYRGTIGGSLANNDPSACYPSAVLALGATIVTSKRRIAAADYFQGMFTTALEPDELITEVSFPIPEKAAYAKFPNPASRYAMVGVFVAKTAAGARVAVTGAGNDGVFRHAAMEAALDQSFTADALKDVTTPESLMNGDIHAGTAYRAHLVGVMARRAVMACK
ncbi:MAG: carbon monoxide dehydrogenase [Acidiphilium sp. 37-64-53]|uniref:FAD binding domain-containing protein n=1 Tax=Acidiphilium TaxID=522 RepID=UPI000BDB8BF4|nr:MULTISPECIES: xanthine dehydrogenase family protein subunit M [Acidiphilium]OYV57889.1 MAG: carbon monoxide dehydrogenase [Acidiphilium sp. 21-62-4]OYW00715.1 MAG: carbon monoxide dehydrogenase [Acidiphilium sp. 37-64-53]OZB26304.1 MAG: carbon monoxide dehydrogenase [Acidiphilium sp. 34-64-41]HQT86435.1 xanthine dehydrogenase family protein subunit M [Acidiphilium rubrum]